MGSKEDQPDVGKGTDDREYRGDGSDLIWLSAVDLVRSDDYLRDCIAKGELTHDVIRGVIRTYLNRDDDQTKTEIALGFGIEQTMPSSIMEGFYAVGGRGEMGNGPTAEDHIDALIDWIS